MARKRMIDPSFWTDEKLGTMAPFIRFLFMGLISNSDDEGRLVGHPALIKSLVFPYDLDISMIDVEKWLKELHDKKSIIIYSVNNQTYIQIKNFKKFQKINRPTPSQLPSVEQLTEYSLNTHEQLTDSSRPIEEKRREENIKEENIREEKDENLSLELSKHVEKITCFKWSIAKEIDKLNVLIEMYTYEWLKDAFNVAVKKNKYSINYVEGILKTWTKEGKEETHGSIKQNNAEAQAKYSGFKPAEPNISENIYTSDII